MIVIHKFAVCIYLQVMDREATLGQDMEKEVCLNRNDVIS